MFYVYLGCLGNSACQFARVRKRHYI